MNSARDWQTRLHPWNSAGDSERLAGACVHPADILRAAIELGAVAFMMAHNHPSGDPAPSDDDVKLTSSVERAAHVIGVPLHDHVIVTPSGRFASVLRCR